MKVPPKRKGNLNVSIGTVNLSDSLNESPSQKEGKSLSVASVLIYGISLNESPSQKEGKSEMKRSKNNPCSASMKVPPKRKGNLSSASRAHPSSWASMKVPPKRKGNLWKPAFELTLDRGLNESPSQKEGKWLPGFPSPFFLTLASMKVPPKRKGNAAGPVPP